MTTPLTDGNLLSRMWRKFQCWSGRHKRLDVISTFGAAQHVGCPYCGRQIGIHHSLRQCVPWGPEFADLYRDFGHDVDRPLARWQQYRKDAGFLK